MLKAGWYCPHCGYDLAGLVTEGAKPQTCPECGEPRMPRWYDPADRPSVWRIAWRLCGPCWICVLLGGVLALLASLYVLQWLTIPGTILSVVPASVFAIAGPVSRAGDLAHQMDPRERAIKDYRDRLASAGIVVCLAGPLLVAFVAYVCVRAFR